MTPFTLPCQISKNTLSRISLLFLIANLSPALQNCSFCEMFLDTVKTHLQAKPIYQNQHSKSVTQRFYLQAIWVQISNDQFNDYGKFKNTSILFSKKSFSLKLAKPHTVADPGERPEAAQAPTSFFRKQCIFFEVQELFSQNLIFTVI